METYNIILQGSAASADEAILMAQCGAALAESGTEEDQTSWSDYRLVDTVNGTHVWYNFVADYYFFSPQIQE